MMRYVAAKVADAATFGMKITLVIYSIITSLLMYYYKNFSA
jgi:hypothetical protein